MLSKLLGTPKKLDRDTESRGGVGDLHRRAPDPIAPATCSAHKQQESKDFLGSARARPEDHGSRFISQQHRAQTLVVRILRRIIRFLDPTRGCRFPVDQKLRMEKVIGELRWKAREYAAQRLRMKKVIGELRWKAREDGANRPVNVCLKFSRLCLDAIDELRADVYVAHGVQALPAAAILARHSAGDYYCDVIEIPSFAARAVPSKWHITNIEFLDVAFESYLRRAAGLLTVGPALGHELKKVNDTIHVIPNYRHAEDLVPSDDLRRQCGLAPTDELVLSISTVATGFEIVLEALAQLPAHVHLASIGTFAPRSYQALCLDRAAALGVAHRVHCFDPVPYRELTSFASSADVGLIVLDPSILNNKISLPNRIFDYMFSAVPVCTPEIPDIANIVRTWNMGAVVNEGTPSAWAAAIREVLARKAAMRANAALASKHYVWDSVEDELYEALGKPRSVCYLGVNSLRDNNRTMRMARSLAKRGVAVTICSQRERADSVTHVAGLGADIRFVPIDV